MYLALYFIYQDQNDKSTFIKKIGNMSEHTNCNGKNNESTYALKAIHSFLGQATLFLMISMPLLKSVYQSIHSFMGQWYALNNTIQDSVHS